MYIIKIDYREAYEGSTILGNKAYSSREEALKVFQEYIFDKYREPHQLIKQFGGGLEEGEFYSEDETIYLERLEFVE